MQTEVRTEIIPHKLWKFKYLGILVYESRNHKDQTVFEAFDPIIKVAGPVFTEQAIKKSVTEYLSRKKNLK